MGNGINSWKEKLKLISEKRELRDKIREVEPNYNEY